MSDLTPADFAPLEAAHPGITAAILAAPSGEPGLRSLITILSITPTFTASFKEIHPKLQASVLQFISGASIEECSKEFRLSALGTAKAVVPPSDAIPIHTIVEGDGTPVKVLVDEEFVNWSSTVKSYPGWTFIPVSVVGLQNVVRWAGSEGKRLRAAGFRQSWSNLFADDGGVVVSLLPLSVATGDSAEVCVAANEQAGVFETIEALGYSADGDRFVRVGAGCTTERFRKWCVQEGLTLDSNTIPVENTFGGIMGSMPHGSGFKNKIPNDHISAVEYVDANGNLQRVDDLNRILTVRGAFGLMGIVTYLTLKLRATQYALCHPIKQHIQLAVPPPPGYAIPDGLKANFTPAEIAAAEKEFARKVQDNYYCEFFWFPYESQIWVNCWDVTPSVEGVGVTESPTEVETFSSWLGNLSSRWLNEQPAFMALPGRVQGSINGFIMLSCSSSTSDGDGFVKTQIVNQIHYRRGTQNFPILDSEFSMPIPPSPTDPTLPNWEHARRCYWDAVSLAYDDQHKTGACRVGVEMRIIGNATTTMAPQKGNQFGTCAIELISNLSSGKKSEGGDGSFEPWTQRVVDSWMALGGNVRPHWGKQWEHITVKTVPIITHLRQVSYKNEILQTLDTLGKIGAEQGWTLQQAHERFSNKTLDALFF